MRSCRPTFAEVQGFDSTVADRPALGILSRCSQVGAGRLSGEFGSAPLARSAVSWWQVSADVRVVASNPTGHHALILVTHAGASARLNGQLVEAGCLVSHSPSAQTDGVMPAGSRFGAIALPPELLEDAIVSPGELQMPEPVDGVAILRPERWAVAELTQFLEELLNLARTQPELFDDDSWRASVEKDALEAFGAAITSGCQVPTASPQSRSHSAEIVARVDAWLDGAWADPGGRRPSVADLCRAAGVRRRRLERAFHDMLGLSPAEHVRLRALNAARQALVSGGPAVTVTRAALDAGFWHLGRFSAWYRDLFGELPSETMQRRE